MKNRKLLTLIMILCVSMSMLGCGNTKENDKINSTENTESISKEVIETEQVESTENSEPAYTEYDTYFLQDGVEPSETTYDMNLLKPDGHTYTLTKSVNLYYTNEKLCGYTKENIDINVVTSNDDYCYVILDHKDGFLLKTKDVEAASVEGIEVAEDNLSEDKNQESSTSGGKKQDTTGTKNESTNTNNNTSNNNTSNTAKEEQTANSEPEVEESDTTFNIDYTPEEALAYYRSQVEAQGMKWDPSIKDVVSWGTGFLPLSKDELNDDYIANDMAGYNYGSGDGTPFRTYYMEIISGEVVDFYGVPSVEVIGWVCD